MHLIMKQGLTFHEEVVVDRGCVEWCGGREWEVWLVVGVSAVEW